MYKAVFNANCHPGFLIRAQRNRGSRICPHLMALMLCAYACVALAAAPAAGAPAGAENDKTPMRIRADEVITDIRQKTINYHNNVILEYRTLTVEADALDYDLGDRGLLHIKGNPVRAVLIRGEQESNIRIRAGYVRMERPYKEIEFSGGVHIDDGDHLIRAEHISLDITKQVYTGKNIQILISDFDKLSDQIDKQDRPVDKPEKTNQ